jgi:hypothetical protein
MTPTEVRVCNVVYVMVGTFFDEYTQKESETGHDLGAAVAAAPNRSYAFYFVDTVTKTIEFEGEEYTKEEKVKSGWYYIEAEVYTLEEVKKLKGNYKTLIRNMISNEWDKVIKCRTGNWKPLGPTDTVL